MIPAASRDFIHPTLIEFVHRALERFQVPRELVGATGEDGAPVPPRLYPPFLDREEFPASDLPGERIESALDRSERLVVVGSPAAATS